MEEDLRKTTTEKGGQHQEGLLVAAEYKGKEGTSRGQEYLEAKYCRRQGQMGSVAPLKKNKKEDDDDYYYYFLEASDTRSKSLELLHLQFYIQK
jgi:hypothetical protein